MGKKSNRPRPQDSHAPPKKGRSTKFSLDPQWNDLAAFAKTAEGIEKGLSLTTIAESMGQQLPAFKLRLDRLAKKYQKPLLETVHGSSTGTRLTETGRELAKSLRSLLNWTPALNKSPGLRVALSQTLLTSQYLATPISEFIQRHGSQLSVELNSDLVFEEVLNQLCRAENPLHLAVLWGLPSRIDIPAAYGRKIVVKAAGEFDTVLISHSWEILRDVTGNEDLAPPKDWSEKLDRTLQNKRLVRLDSTNQIANDQIPYSERSLEVNSWDAVTAAVRARLGDVAVVPAVYRELDRHRRLRQLWYSQPLPEIFLPIAIFQRKGESNPLVQDFVERLRNKIQRQSNRREHCLAPPTVGVPREAEFYRSLKHSYYIDSPISNTTDMTHQPLRWNWENVGITDVLRESDSSPWKVSGSLYTEFGSTFKFTGEVEHSGDEKPTGYFRLQATQEKGPSKTSKFVTQYTLTRTNGNNRVLLGVWSGPDNSGNPAINGAIISQERLTPKELADHAAALTIHSCTSCEVPEEIEA